MRMLIGAVAALLLASTAGAQTTPSAPSTPAPPSACGETSAAPTQPDAAHATAAQMTHANQTFQAWATDTRAKLQCRQNEVRTLAAQAQAAESAYNTQASAFVSTVNSWQAATTAFNQQHSGGSNRSTHGSVVGNHGDVQTGHSGGTDSD